MYAYALTNGGGGLRGGGGAMYAHRERCYCFSAFHSLRNQASVFRYVNIALDGHQDKTIKNSQVDLLDPSRLDTAQKSRKRDWGGGGGGDERAKRKERKYV